MSYSKTQRQRAVADLIRGNALSSQEELAERLSALGYSVTQATISRDLEQIGAVKSRRAGRLAYVLPDEVGEAIGPAIDKMLREWVRSIDTALNTVVIKTPPGSAHLIGVALDQSDMSEIVGTICGDDTIFVACRSVSDAQQVATEFKLAAGERAR